MMLSELWEGRRPLLFIRMVKEDQDAIIDD